MESGLKSSAALRQGHRHLQSCSLFASAEGRPEPCLSIGVFWIPTKHRLFFFLSTLPIILFMAPEFRSETLQRHANAMHTHARRQPVASLGLWRRRPAECQKQRRNPAAFRAADQQIHRTRPTGVEERQVGRGKVRDDGWVGWSSGALLLSLARLGGSWAGVLFVGEARHPSTLTPFLGVLCCMLAAWVLSAGPQSHSPSPTLRSADGKAGCRPHVRVPARPRPAAGYLAALTRQRLTTDGQRYQAAGKGKAQCRVG